MLTMGTPITLGGEPAIVVKDHVGPGDRVTIQDPALVSEANRHRNAIWISEKVISELRREYPDVPIFGFWQVLIASGLVDRTEYQVYLQSGQTPEEGAGPYLHLVNGFIEHSGEFRAGRPLMDMTRFITDHDYRVIEVNESRLKRPADFAKTRSELRKEYETWRRTRYSRWGIAAGLGLALAYTAQLGVEWVDGSRQATAEQLEDEIARLERMQSRQEESRFNQRGATFPSGVRPLVELTTRNPGVTVSAVRLNRPERVRGVIQAERPEPTPGFVFEPVDTGEWRAYYRGDG